MGADGRQRITVETERVVIIASRYAVRGWCERCGHEVEMLSADRAQQFFEIGHEQFEARDQSKLHLGRAKDGLVVCLKSLLRFLQRAGPQQDG
jgi:hypothetical protein